MLADNLFAFCRHPESVYVSWFMQKKLYFFVGAVLAAPGFVAGTAAGEDF